MGPIWVVISVHSGFIFFVICLAIFFPTSPPTKLAIKLAPENLNKGPAKASIAAATSTALPSVILTLANALTPLEYGRQVHSDGLSARGEA